MKLDERLSVVRPGWLNDRVHFFKFMSLDTARVVLKNRTLRWSTPGTLNDPYDVQFDLQVNVDRARVRELAVSKLWEVFQGEREVTAGNPLGALIKYMGSRLPDFSRAEFEQRFGDAVDEGFARMMRVLPSVNAEVRQNMADSKLLCLTEDPTSPPMWAHYGGNNTGVVLRLRSIPFLDSAFGVAKPVSYVDDLPHLLDEDFLAEMAVGQQSIDPEVTMDRMVWTKGSTWAYEKEWRICAGSGRNASDAFEDIPFYDLELDGVIVGLKMEAGARAEIAALAAHYSNVELFEACRSATALRHEIRPLGSSS